MKSATANERPTISQVTPIPINERTGCRRFEDTAANKMPHAAFLNGGFGRSW